MMKFTNVDLKTKTSNLYIQLGRKTTHF